MSTSFESIFATNTNTKSNLDALFKNSKSKVNPNTNSIVEAIVKSDEISSSTAINAEAAKVGVTTPIKARASSRNKSKIKKLNPETESRTVFVGNLPNTTKKEVK